MDIIERKNHCYTIYLNNTDSTCTQITDGQWQFSFPFLLLPQEKTNYLCTFDLITIDQQAINGVNSIKNAIGAIGIDTGITSNYLSGNQKSQIMGFYQPHFQYRPMINSNTYTQNNSYQSSIYQNPPFLLNAYKNQNSITISFYNLNNTFMKYLNYFYLILYLEPID
jgi:hypothetical protein